MPFGIGGNLKGISKTVKTAKANVRANTIGLIAEVVGSVAPAIITASYNKKNAQFQKQIEDNLAKLSDAQLQDIRDNLLKISDSNERLSVLMNYLADKLGTASAITLRDEIIGNVTGAVNKETKQIYWFIGISVAVLIGIVVVKKIIK